MKLLSLYKDILVEPIGFKFRFLISAHQNSLMAVAAPRRLRSGSLSSDEASNSEEEDTGRMKSFVTQVQV